MSVSNVKVMAGVAAGLVTAGALVGSAIGASEPVKPSAPHDHRFNWQNTAMTTMLAGMPVTVGAFFIGEMGRPQGAAVLLGLGLLGGAAVGISSELVRSSRS